MSAPQGLEIEEKLLWEYEEPRYFGFFLWFDDLSIEKSITVARSKLVKKYMLKLTNEVSKVEVAAILIDIINNTIIFSLLFWG